MTFYLKSENQLGFKIGIEESFHKYKCSVLTKTPNRVVLHYETVKEEHIFGFGH